MPPETTSRAVADTSTAQSRANLRFRDLRARVGHLTPSNYDISDTCNLRCEGCLFFDGADRLGHDDSADDDAWDSFFAKEAARGVNFAYLAGAEPTLAPRRISLARKYIPHGVIFTNGTRRVSPDLDYRIHISVWGAPAENARLRGADNVAKAIRLYAGDPRAIFVYTIGRTNIRDIFETARAMHEAGCALTFSYFSPTTSYLSKLESDVAEDDYFKISTAEDNLVMMPSDFAEARCEITRAIEAFGATILYSLDYDAWITSDVPHRIDPVSGIAIDCGNRLTPKHLHFSVDLSQSTGKCCSPNIDCSGCRAYAQGYGTYLKRFAEVRHDAVALDRWLSVWELWARMFLPPSR